MFWSYAEISEALKKSLVQGVFVANATGFLSQPHICTAGNVVLKNAIIFVQCDRPGQPSEIIRFRAMNAGRISQVFWCFERHSSRFLTYLSNYDSAN